MAWPKGKPRPKKEIIPGLTEALAETKLMEAEPMMAEKTEAFTLPDSLRLAIKGAQKVKIAAKFRKGGGYTQRHDSFDGDWLKGKTSVAESDVPEDVQSGLLDFNEVLIICQRKNVEGVMQNTSRWPANWLKGSNG